VLILLCIVNIYSGHNNRTIEKDILELYPYHTYFDTFQGYKTGGEIVDDPPIDDCVVFRCVRDCNIYCNKHVKISIEYTVCIHKHCAICVMIKTYIRKF
jgi:hypothetical protein